jgi:hypothetical protein
MSGTPALFPVSPPGPPLRVRVASGLAQAVTASAAIRRTRHKARRTPGMESPRSADAVDLADAMDRLGRQDHDGPEDEAADQDQQ